MLSFGMWWVIYKAIVIVWVLCLSVSARPGLRGRGGGVCVCVCVCDVTLCHVTWILNWAVPYRYYLFTYAHTHTQFWIALSLIPSIYVSLPIGTPLLAWSLEDAAVLFFSVTGTRFAGGENNPTRLHCPSNRGMSLSFFLFVISSDKNSRSSLKL